MKQPRDFMQFYTLVINPGSPLPVDPTRSHPINRSSCTASTTLPTSSSGVWAKCTWLVDFQRFFHPALFVTQNDKKRWTPYLYLKYGLFLVFVRFLGCKFRYVPWSIFIFQGSSTHISKQLFSFKHVCRIERICTRYDTQPVTIR